MLWTGQPDRLALPLGKPEPIHRSLPTDERALLRRKALPDRLEPLLIGKQVRLSSGTKALRQVGKLVRSPSGRTGSPQADKQARKPSYKQVPLGMCWLAGTR